MAVTHLRVQLELKMGSEGWSETYYHAGSDPKAFQSQAISLARERQKILAAVAKIHHIRISAAMPGARAYRFPLLNPNGGLAGSSTRDVGAITLTVGCYTSDNAFRKIGLHGFPDITTAFDTDGNLNVGMPAGVPTFFAYLVAQAYEIRHRKKPFNDLSLVGIKNITVTNGLVMFETVTTGLSPKDKVLVRSAKGYKVGQFNGVWVVKDIVVGPPAGFTAQTKRLVDDQFFYSGNTATWTGGGTDAVDFLPMTAFDDFCERGTRKVGRPTDVPRGRRSSRR